MNDLISRKEVKAIANKFTFTDKTQERQYKDFLNHCLDNALTVEPVRGEWIVKEDENCFATWDYCSICGFSTGFAGSSHYINFCPNCGADMRRHV